MKYVVSVYGMLMFRAQASGKKKRDKLTIDIDGWGRKETILLKMSRKQLTVQNVDKHK